MPGHTWHQPDEALFRSTEHGVAKAAGLKDDRSAMPAGERVPGDEAIVAALSWIRAPWPADVRSRHGAVNRQGPR